MFWISLLLTAALLIGAVLAGKGVLVPGSGLPLRCCCSLLQGVITLGVVLFYFEIAYLNIQMRLAYGGYEGQNTEFLRFAEIALTGFAAAAVIACAIVVRTCKKPFVPWLAGIGAFILLGAGALVGIRFGEPDYFSYLIPAVVGVVLFAAMFWTNALLSFDEGWRRVAVTAVNALTFLTMAGVAVYVLRIGAQVLEGAAIDFGDVLLIGLATVAFLTPSALAVGSVIAGHLRAAQE